MEDSSHELIDQMIAKEQYCYGFEAVSSLNNTTALSNTSSQVQIQLPVTHTGEDVGVKKEHGNKQMYKNDILENKKESKPKNEEDKSLVDAVEACGYGHWIAVAEHVKTRNPLQCKNRARQKIPASPQQKKSKPGHKIDSTVTLTKTAIMPKTKSVSFADTCESITQTTTQEMLIPIPQDITASISTAESEVPTTDVDNLQNDPSKEQEDSSKEQEVECNFDLTGITDHEQKENTEWFLGKPAKTPERYMRIRNHIISCWKKSSPYYLTKTAGRKHLADCGDVNAVGRIHAYLESIQVININCSSPVKRNYGRSSHRLEDGSPRKKKVKKTPGYFWADVDDEDEFGENCNIIKGDGKSRPKRAVKKPETFYNEHGHESGHGNDPFTLVPVGYYPNQKSAPFTVDITSNALLVMEFHSHLAYTEIIGLLGGRVVHKEDGTKQLKVEYVFPCRSTSTGIQCEMDPVSEMAAREVFEQKGLHVVGWYHSHPTFEPEPSIRDIENQTSYQDLFRDDVSGVEPFIGVIITPYNSRNIVSDRSQFQFIHISKRWNVNNSYRLPFACLQNVTQCETISNEVLEIIQNLITEYRTYEHKIDMNLRYGDITRLEKLMRSLKNHLFMSPENNEKFLLDLKEMIQKNFHGNGTLLSQEEIPKQMDTIIRSLAI
ncbi:hypothetical protein INT48_008022 [Thamnidium elegans]|uniref:Myb-like, SWIRM and MPN domain-containing protein 1 n=1 Tax=Thamnidium elegans TaxID=101142 RepID=A0A8H7VVS3_9FUNG|nr:hypothetical protein INT48_008022 [Thamnidium elegans]